MISRVARRAVLIVLATLTLTGCGRQVAQDSSAGMVLPAISPDRGALPVPPPHAAEALGATGGLNAWLRAREIRFDAVVAAYRPDGGFYLTEHEFAVCPWGRAVQVSAREPHAMFTCRIIDGQYHLLGGDPGVDVSPLSACYRDYAEAVFQIVTAPARMLDTNVELLRRPVPVMIGGQWYHTIEATFKVRRIVSQENGKEKVTIVEPYWTRGIYFQNRNGSLVDRIWLGSPAAQDFLIVRGYDYAKAPGSGVLIPNKIEIFRSDAEGVQGQRLALIDVKR
jgi:hypothetical protein